jgi:hypothetical protein
MNYFTSLSLLAGLGPPYSRRPASFEAGLELSWIPELSASQRRVGFNGTKEEDLNKAPIFARPRLTIGLPWSTALTLSYVPPIRLFGVTPNLFAFGVERPVYDRKPWTVGVRAYGQIGDIEGAFTCSEEAARSRPGSPQNPLGNPALRWAGAHRRVPTGAGEGPHAVRRGGGELPRYALPGRRVGARRSRPHTPSGEYVDVLRDRRVRLSAQRQDASQYRCLLQPALGSTTSGDRQ